MTLAVHAILNESMVPMLQSLSAILEAFDDNKRKISDPVLVAIDIRAVSFK
jgi:hypothetical protein